MKIKSNILIIDNNVNFLNDVDVLLSEQFNITKAVTGKEGLNYLKNKYFSAVLLDLKLPDINGLEILKKINTEIDPNLPVIIVTDFGEINTAVEAMKIGAYDFIQKDFNVELLCREIMKVLEKSELIKTVKTLQEENLKSDKFIFRSKIMTKVNYEIDHIVANDIDVLLLGESGVGKDLIAREIHKRSKRKDKLFIPLSLQCLSENLIETELFGYEKGAFSGADKKIKFGKFEGANNGTIYLPEISKLSENIQLKLLQFMQYKIISRVGRDGKDNDIQLDVRIIMASNDELNELVNSGKLRKDFYYRINAVKIYVPPLRERIEDIEPLCNYFLKEYKAKLDMNEDIDISKEAMEVLIKYDWPGNVRELENIIKNALIFNDEPVLNESCFNLTGLCRREINAGIGNYHYGEQQFKMKYFTELLDKTNGNKTKAAKLAGISRQGLLKILKELEIE